MGEEGAHKKVIVAVGTSRKSLEWKNKDVSWEGLVKRFSRTHITEETEAEYKAMNKDRRNNVKDIGGIVGGELSGPQRKRENLVNRCILALDIDYGTADTWDDYQMMCDWECLMHTTHSHTAESPRYRMYFPLSRVVTPEEYAPVARMVASMINIELFDDTTFEASRLMYWPSTCKDGEFKVFRQEGPWINPDEILSRYVDWKDESTWPVSSRMHQVIRKSIKDKQADPRSKNGLVGAFCRVYDIHEAIAKYLSDEYEATDEPDRYTYTKGTTSKGLKVFQEGLFAQSWHDSDPAHGRLCNAFDLVRLHKFPEMDEKTSFQAMMTFLDGDERVQEELDKMIYGSAAAMFDDGFDEEELERDEMDLTETGNALRLNDRFGMYMCYNPSLKWCTWDGVKWVSNSENMSIRNVMRLNDQFRKWTIGLLEKNPMALDEEGKPKKEQTPERERALKAYAWAIQSRNWSRINNTLKAARGTMKEEKTDSFDRDPWDLNTPLGIVDLKTGEMKPHSPGARCTHITNVSPDWNMSREIWNSFLDLVTCGDEDLKKYLQEIAGMALVGEVYEENLIMCVGNGSNGKSTLFEIWMDVMGDYAGAVRNEVILGNRWGNDVAGTNQLRGKRLVVMSELEEKQIMSNSLMKRMTSRDSINANVKFAEPITFKPTHTLILHTNHLPRLQSVDYGVVRRVAIIPFNATIQEKDKRTDFAEEMLSTEGPAILAWMIDGAVRFYSNHMTIQKPTAVLEASKSYIEGEDLLFRYIESNCRMAAGAKAYVSNLYQDFRTWCADEGLQKPPYGRNQFSRELQKRYGLQSGHDNKGTCLKGIALSDDDGGI